MIYRMGTYAQRNSVSSDYALDFDNTSYTESVPIGLNYLTNTRTISLRVKLDTTTFNGQARNFMFAQYAGSGQRTTYCEFRDTGVIRIGIPTTTTGNTTVILESNAGVYFNANQWYYISITLTGTRAELYVDNVMQTQTVTTSLPFTRTGATFTVGNFGTYLPAFGFTGTIQDVSVWNDARTQSELLADETRVFTGSEAGLKGHWSMDEGSGTTITDASGTQVKTISSTNSVAAMWVVIGNSSYQSLNFNSSGTANQDVLNVGNTVMNNARTFSFFFTPTVNITSSTGLTTICRRMGGFSSGEVLVAFVTGKIYVLLRDSSGYQTYSDVVGFTAGTEYHFSVISDSSSGTRMLIDGVQQTSTMAKTTSFLTNANDFTFGYPHSTWLRPQIKIRNVQVFSTALTNSEVITNRALYLPSGTTNLIETWHFKDETGVTATGENGNNGTITTSNAGGTTYIDSTVRD
jgi:hypothetical protein